MATHTDPEFIANTDLVESSKIEDIVGVPRLRSNHVIRAVSSEHRTYLLHSQRCASTTPDLRECPFAIAQGEYGLWGISPEECEDGDGYEWVEDTPIVVMINEDGFLAPDPANTKSLPGLIAQA